MKNLLRMIAILGILIFAATLSITFISHQTLEASAKNFIQQQIAKDIHQQYQGFLQSDISQKAQQLSHRLGFEKDDIEQKLSNNLPEKIASVIASMCGYDCEKKKAVAKSITSDYLKRISNIQVAQDTLGNIIKGQYIHIIDHLKTDLRIFLGSNLFMFLILLATSYSKPQAIKHLFLPAILLLTATLLSTAIYIFGQDWFYTILYNDYMGFAYLAYIGVIFAILMDIVLNQAKVTTEIINSIANAIGSALTVTPC